MLRTALFLAFLSSTFAPAAIAQICGDANQDGAANIVDALQAAQHSAGVITLVSPGFELADVEPRTAGGMCDLDVDILDALIIAQAAAGLIMTMDCCAGPAPGAPVGEIRSLPAGVVVRDDVPLRIEAMDDERDFLSIQVEFSTDGGSTWALATMSDFVTAYGGASKAYQADSDEGSYGIITYNMGSGTFQVGEIVTCTPSGVQGRVFDILGPGRIVMEFVTGRPQDCDTVVGMSSGAQGAIEGTACGSMISGIGRYSRAMIMGSPLFDPGTPGSTANPVTGVYPSRFLTFVWDTVADVPAGASPAMSVMVRAILDDGALQTTVNSGIFTVDNSPPATDHLLLTELSITGGEFCEIHNPTSSPIDLTDYYLTDATFASGSQFYYNIATGGAAGGGGFSDWFARFPAGTMIMPGQYMTIAGSVIQFNASYGVNPDFTMCASECPGMVPCMLPAGGGIDTVATCGSMSGTTAFSDDGEMIVLFHWDGVSSTVDDVDYIVWGDKNEAVDKSGVAGYQPDVPTAMQETLGPGLPGGDAHNTIYTVSRIDLEEGNEIAMGGNGITGNNEMSEDLSVTWGNMGIPTPGRPTMIVAPLDAEVQPQDILVNEVLYRAPSDTNGDGAYSAGAPWDDAFVEFVNVSSNPVDLTGWRAHNPRTIYGLSHVFPPGTVLMPNEAVVVWGGGTPTGAFCGAPFLQTALDGSWFFNTGSGCNSADGIVLSQGGTIIDWNYECNNDIPASFTRDPDAMPGSPFVNHTMAATSGGMPFSPGCKADGTGF